MVEINEEMKKLIYCLLKKDGQNEIPVTDELMVKIPNHFDIIAQRDHINGITTYKIQEYLR
jgi:hypothetical protein